MITKSWDAEDEHYFCYNLDKGYAVLISEGYSSEGGRDNGIASVQKNMTNPDRYARKTNDAGRNCHEPLL